MKLNIKSHKLNLPIDKKNDSHYVSLHYLDSKNNTQKKII